MVAAMETRQKEDNLESLSDEQAHPSPSPSPSRWP